MKFSFERKKENCNDMIIKDIKGIFFSVLVDDTCVGEYFMLTSKNESECIYDGELEYFPRKQYTRDDFENVNGKNVRLIKYCLMNRIQHNGALMLDDGVYDMGTKIGDSIKLPAVMIRKPKIFFDDDFDAPWNVIEIYEFFEVINHERSIYFVTSLPYEKCINRDGTIKRWIKKIIGTDGYSVNFWYSLDTPTYGNIFEHK